MCCRKYSRMNCFSLTYSKMQFIRTENDFFNIMLISFFYSEFIFNPETAIYKLSPRYLHIQMYELIHYLYHQLLLLIHFPNTSLQAGLIHCQAALMTLYLLSGHFITPPCISSRGSFVSSSLDFFITVISHDTVLPTSLLTAVITAFPLFFANILPFELTVNYILV